MKAIILGLIALSYIFFLPGCATIIHGTTQKIQVTSNPDNAKVKVSDGKEYTTPVAIELSRKNDHILIISKDNYFSQQIVIMHVISGAVAGNILAGGLIGWGIDASSGAQYKLVPEIVHVILESSRGKILTPEEQNILNLTPEIKLKKLEELKNQHLITDQEYESMRKIILNSIVK